MKLLPTTYEKGVYRGDGQHPVACKFLNEGESTSFPAGLYEKQYAECVLMIDDDGMYGAINGTQFSVH
jgi:hypothetical protein